MLQPLSERMTRRWGWWTIGLASAICVALMTFSLWQQQKSSVFRHALVEYQAARAQASLAILDLAIAEDGAQGSGVDVSLTSADRALSDIERLLPRLPGGARADAMLIDHLHAMRLIVTADVASKVRPSAMHHDLQISYRALVVALEERWTLARNEFQTLNRRQTQVANVALLAALATLGGTAALLRYLHLLRLRNRRRMATLTHFRSVVGRINESILHAGDFHTLAQAVCTIATEVPGVACAAVHMHDPVGHCLVRQGINGPCSGLVGDEPLSLAGSASATVQAFLHARRILVTRPGQAALCMPCPDHKACRSIQSMTAIPLMRGQSCIGVLTLLSGTRDFFHADSADLLDECAASISFAAEKISDQKSLRESEARYRSLVEVSPDGILVICDDQIVMANAVALRQLGATDADQVIGHALLEFVAPAQQAECRQRMQQVYAERQPMSPMETVFQRVDGQFFEVEVVGGPFPYMGRTAILSQWHDLTTRRESQRRLIERERDLLLSQKAGQIGSAVINLKAGTWSTSPVGQDILGVSDGQNQPMAAFAALLDPACAAVDGPRFRANIASDAKSDSVYAIVRPADGGRRWIRVITEPEMREDGPPLRRIGVVLDVTEAHIAAQRIHQLSRLYEALSKINSALSRESDFKALCDTVCKVLVTTGGLGFAAVELDRHPEPDPVVASAPWQCARYGTEPDQQTSSGHLLRFDLMSGSEHLGCLLVAAIGGHAMGGQNLQLIGEAADALGFAHAKHSSELGRKQSERRIAAIVDTAMDAIITCDNNFRIVTFNHAATALFGLPHEQAIGSELEHLLPERFRGAHETTMRAFAASGKTYRSIHTPALVTALRTNGEEFPAEASISHVKIGALSFFTVILRDVTTRMASDARIARLSRLYAAQSNANEVIVRGRQWLDVCQQVCRVIVEQGELHSALIRVPDELRQVLEPFAGYGQRSDDFLGQRVTFTDDHPVAVAFREARPVRMADLQLGSDYAGARRDAIARGAASAIALPILGQNGPLGTLSVFAREGAYFDAELEQMLMDLADNLAYAWDKLRSESEVRSSEERYRALFENSPDGLRIISEDRIVKVNPAYIRLFGENPTGQTVQQAIFDHLDAETLEKVRARMQRVANENLPVTPDEQTYRRSDGVAIPVESTSAPFMLGEKQAHLTIIRDLRELRARQNALKAAETRYRSLVETSLSGIALVHEDRFEYANTALARMFGLEQAAEMIGRPFLDLVDPAFQAISTERLHQLAAAPGAVFPHGRLRLRTVHGNAIDADLAATSVDLEGRTMVLLEMRDVTREVIAKQGLRDLNKSLENRVAQRTAELVSLNREMTMVNRDLESFSYSVAHDLRVPLRHMAGFAHMIQMDLNDQHFEELPAHVERIVGGVSRMSGLIDGLMAVSRVAHMALDEQAVDLSGMLAEVLQELNPGPAVQWDIAPLPQICGDKVLLRQVWTNLLSNAIKYSAKAAHPHIIVHSITLGHEQVFSVRDNGAGFDPAQASGLFGVFKRLHSHHEFAGTGVGLAIVRRIVERHGGRIWADAAPGQGATFSFSLPLERIHPVQAAADLSRA